MYSTNFTVKMSTVKQNIIHQEVNTEEVKEENPETTGQLSNKANGDSIQTIKDLQRENTFLKMLLQSIVAKSGKKSMTSTGSKRKCLILENLFRYQTIVMNNYKSMGVSSVKSISIM